MKLTALTVLGAASSGAAAYILSLPRYSVSNGPSRPASLSRRPATLEGTTLLTMAAGSTSTTSTNTSRRDSLHWLSTACSLTTLTLVSGSAAAARSSAPSSPPSDSLPSRMLPLPFYQAIRAIKQYCEDNGTLEQYRAAGGRFLYRGEKVDGSALIYAPPDLLDAETYHDPEAAEWFRAVDGGMRARRDPVCPSEGHLTTSDIRAAGSWGNPCSIWPIGALHFAWLNHNRMWWAGQDCAKVDYRALRSDAKQLRTFLSSELRVDEGLPRAIARGHEVLLTCKLPDEEEEQDSSSGTAARRRGRRSRPLYGYIAVPFSQEEKLREALDLPLRPSRRAQG